MELSAWKYYNFKTTERKENYFQEFFTRVGLLLQYSVGLRTNYPITSIRAELLLHQISCSLIMKESLYLYLKARLPLKLDLKENNSRSTPN